MGTDDDFTILCSLAFTNLPKSTTVEDETLVKEILLEIDGS